MTDTNTQEDPQVQSPPAAEPQNTDNGHMIPKSRFDEVNERAKKLEAQIADIERKQQQAETKRLEEQGEFKRLADERAKEIERLSPYQSQYEAMLENIKAQNTVIIEQVPEDKRRLIPDDYEPVKLQAWLNANRDVLVGQSFTPPATNGGAGTYQRPGQGLKPLSSEEQAIAKKMGISAEDYQLSKAAMNKGK